MSPEVAAVRHYLEVHLHEPGHPQGDECWGAADTALKALEHIDTRKCMGCRIYSSFPSDHTCGMETIY